MKLDREVVRRKDIQSRRVGEDVFLVDEENQSIHKLNVVSAAVWEIMQDQVSVRTIVDTIHMAFPSEKRGKVKRDIKDLLEGLIEEDLIELH